MLPIQHAVDNRQTGARTCSTRHPTGQPSPRHEHFGTRSWRAFLRGISRRTHPGTSSSRGDTASPRQSRLGLNDIRSSRHPRRHLAAHYRVSCPPPRQRTFGLLGSNSCPVTRYPSTPPSHLPRRRRGDRFSQQAPELSLRKDHHCCVAVHKRAKPRPPVGKPIGGVRRSAATRPNR